MGKLLNTKTYIDENIFKYEERLSSQYNIFLDKSPTFTIYYHINNLNSITDTGFQNIEKVLGKDSPIRFQKIKDFPIYGIDTMKLDLQDDEEGLNISYEGEGIILPNTIVPMPNDFFIITYLGKRYVFMVTGINYDTIKSNGFYSINYQLKSIDDTDFEEMEDQVLENYTCIYDNIGTEDKCLLQDDELEIYKKLDDLYTKLVTRYKVLFYSKRFNSLLFHGTNQKYIYDKYLTHFVEENKLLNMPDDYDTMVLCNEDYVKEFDLEYELSFYNCIEEKNRDDLKPARAMDINITYPNSVFTQYSANNIKSVWFIPSGGYEYVRDDFIRNIHHNTMPKIKHPIEELLIKYFNDGIESISMINIEELSKYRIKYDRKDFILVPVLLFILRYYVEKFMKTLT